jgi:hypothetical protein
LSEYDVPDDDMSDSLPPIGGPDPLDGWDLEGLLSGESVWLPDGMRPVAATLAALRGGPLRSEVAGEASARAAFRQVMLAGESGPGGPGQVGDGNTLILPARAPDGGARLVARPRHAHRRPPRRVRWRPKALAGVAAVAAVVVVGGIALAGGFTGGGRQAGPSGQSIGAASATTRPAAANGGAGLGSATKEPTAHPTQSASAQQSPATGSGSSRSTLCRQYWAFFAHHESAANWSAEQANLRELSEMAGSPWNINRYCMAYYQWGFAPPATGGNSGGDQGGTGQQDLGNPQGNNQPAPHPGDGKPDNDAKNQGNGSGNSGNQH